MFRYSPRLLALGVLICVFPLASGVGQEPPKDDPRQPPLPKGAVKRLGSAAFQSDEMARGLLVLPGAKQLVIADKKHFVLWDLTTGKRLTSTPLVTPSNIASIPWSKPETVFAANGKELIAIRAGVAYQLSVTLEGEPIRLPNPSAPPVVPKPTPGLQEGIVEVRFGPEGRLFGATTSGRLVERKVGIGDVVGWRDTGLTAVKGPKTVMAGGGDAIAMLGADEKIRLWDAAKGKDLGTIDAPNARFLAVSPDGKTVATLDDAANTDWREVRLWSVAERKVIDSWTPAARLMSRVVFSPDGEKLAIANGVVVELHETKSGKLLHTLPDVGGEVRALQFFPDGSTLIAAGASGAVRQWDVRTGAAVGPKHTGHTGPVRAVVSTKDGGWISAGTDRNARLWDKEGKEVREFVGHSMALTALVLSADEKTLFTTGQDGTVRAWDVAKGTELRQFKFKPNLGQQGDGMFYCLALSPNGKTLAAGLWGGRVRLLDTETLTSKAVLDSNGDGPVVIDFSKGWTNAVTFSGDNLLVTRDCEQAIRVWDLEKGKEIRKFDARAGDCDWVRMCTSPNGKRVATPIGSKGASGSHANRLGIWEVETGKLLYEVGFGGEQNLTAVTFLPDGKGIAVGNARGNVFVIDLEKTTATARHTFTRGHNGPVLCLSASPDGKTLSSGGADTTVLVWNLDKPK